MVFDKSAISAECATRLLRRFLEEDLTVTGMERLHGGMINSVLELRTDGRPARVVAKLNAEPGLEGFRWESRVLEWYRQNTDFPVPRPYGYDLSGETFSGSVLMMERLPGVNLAEARLIGEARRRLETEMARIIARLHRHKRSTYGSALDPASEGEERWLDRFGPRIRSEYESVADRLSSSARRSIRSTLDELEDWLPEFSDPTLVHGDLWATNIIVEPREPAVSGFVDGGANYSEVEYELAYLLVFNTVGEAFFGEYERHHALREGFRRRCRVYWLNTMLLHVRVFGDAHYVQACERLATELDHLRG